MEHSESLKSTTVARSYDNINICTPLTRLESGAEMVILLYLVVTITELSHVTWHSLVNYHEKHYVTVYRT